MDAGWSRWSSGAPGDAFSDAAALLDHGFAAFTEHTFVTAGEPNGVVALPGGSVPVEVGADLSALVPIAALADVREQVVVDPSAAYPPAPGERVARLKITLPGLTVGRVPLVVSSVPPPPPHRRSPVVGTRRRCGGGCGRSGRGGGAGLSAAIHRAFRGSTPFGCYARAR